MVKDVRVKEDGRQMTENGKQRAGNLLRVNSYISVSTCAIPVIENGLAFS
jgi:hypothetical protein